MHSRFAMVRRDELWVRGALAESRLNAGEAIDDGRTIVARNGIDSSLRDRCEAEMNRVRPAIAAIRDARVRCVVTATEEDLESTIAVTVRGISVVSTPETIDADYALLKQTPTRHKALGARHFIWKNGSAAVLLHEAIGHAAEHGHEPLDWPAWLSVRDESRAGTADLIAGEAPRASRRESFRDVPLRRMTTLAAEQHGAPLDVPDDAINIYLVAGGAYEPLTEIVTINIAVSDAGAFTIRAPRRSVARSLLGATGNPIRYPGVICSREGQELYVGSHAPVIVTSDIA
ncbi:MAG TPA: hypothetical protein VJ853_02190 [Thermoanaerobaculia bacterium]|nr:hypothetical protein [Thermoanaerobaculia bacterium]